MSWVATAATVVGAGVSAYSASRQNDANQEAVEASQEIPEWLRPYYIGTGQGQNMEPVPVNYNWLDSMNEAAASGMPQSVPPMSMNNQMMTFNDVYTPTEGGPWGHGLSPGQLTSEVGIPGESGSQFINQPEGFVPGTQGAQAGGAGADAGGNVLDPGLLDIAQQYISAANTPFAIGGDDGFMQSRVPTTLQALQWAQENQDLSATDIYRQGLIAPYLSGRNS